MHSRSQDFTVKRGRHAFDSRVFWVNLIFSTTMRTASQLALLLVASNLAAHGQHFRQVTIATGPSPRWIAVADVNHDRYPDIVVANAGSDSTDSGSITVLLGDGRGGFHPAPGSPLPAGHLPNDIAIADMNNDGNLDLVIANHQSPYL